jgi:DNA-binding response OmpR family regulator
VRAGTPVPPETVRPHRVLVADDEPHIGHIIQMKLEQGPYDVTLVSDGRAALDELRKHDPIDLVLLDIMMPHANGLEVLAEARRLEHRRETPVIILTAKGQDADRKQALALGAIDFFTKPFSPKKLMARVDELFGHDVPPDAGDPPGGRR